MRRFTKEELDNMLAPMIGGFAIAVGIVVAYTDWFPEWLGVFRQMAEAVR